MSNLTISPQSVWGDLVKLDVESLYAGESVGALPPSNIVPAGTNFSLRLELRLRGPLAPFRSTLGGQMVVQYFLESIGPAGEHGHPDIPAVCRDMSPSAGTNYIISTNVPAGTLAPNSIYRIGAIINTGVIAGGCPVPMPNTLPAFAGPGPDMTAFVEGLVIQTT